MTPTPQKNKIGIKQILIIAVVLAIVCGVILTVGYFANKALGDEFSAKEMDEIMDEIMRVKHFISDWYAEISSIGMGNGSVYLNEIRFGSNEYTLTFAGARLRAVYPRGERFMKLDFIRKVEFFSIDDKTRCRLYYGNTGEYTFSV